MQDVSIDKPTDRVITGFSFEVEKVLPTKDVWYRLFLLFGVGPGVAFSFGNKITIPELTPFQFAEAQQALLAQMKEQKEKAELALQNKTKVTQMKNQKKDITEEKNKKKEKVSSLNTEIANADRTVTDLDKSITTLESTIDKKLLSDIYPDSQSSQLVIPALTEEEQQKAVEEFYKSKMSNILVPKPIDEEPEEVVRESVSSNLQDFIVVNERTAIDEYIEYSSHPTLLPDALGENASHLMDFIKLLERPNVAEVLPRLVNRLDFYSDTKIDADKLLVEVMVEAGKKRKVTEHL